MPERFCTCGAVVQPTAEFCPNCGCPLTQDALTREREAHAAEIRREPVEPGADQPPSFGNPHALRAAYWSAAVAAIICSLPFMLLLGFVIYPAAGYFTVRSFQRRSGSGTSESDGAMLGFMTGVITFALFMVLLAANTLMLGSDGMISAVDEFATQLAETGQAEFAETVREMLSSPSVVASYLLSMLLFFFSLVTGFTSLGGVLGAKILEED